MPPETDETPPEQSVEQWARELLAAIGKKEARKILADYEAIAADSKVTKAGRVTAAERAEALKRLI